MFISMGDFKLSALFCIKRFMIFAHFLALYKSAKKKYEYALAANVDVNKAKDLLTNQINAAISKLFALDKEYFNLEGRHIVSKLSDINDYEAALDEFHIDFDA